MTVSILHFLANKLQPPIHRRLGLDFILLEQHRPDELINLLAILELLEFACDALVFCLLSFELLA